MNLKNYLLEYVSSGRGRHLNNMDDSMDELPDDFRELIDFIEALGYEEEYEFDALTKRKVYFYMDPIIPMMNPVGCADKWLYAKNPAVGKDKLLFIEIETRNNKVSNITKLEIQSPGGTEYINIKEALEYLRS